MSNILETNYTNLETFLSSMMKHDLPEVEEVLTYLSDLDKCVN